MTIRKRLARSNVIMILTPVFVTFLVVMGALGILIYVTETVYLPRLGLTLEELHIVSSRFDGTFADLEIALWVLVGILIVTVAITVTLADIYFTRYITRHITQPLDTLVAGVRRIRDGDLESPIIYYEQDEFFPACVAVNLMAERLKQSMERDQEEQQRRRELFAGISHDLKSPLTSIRAYTEALMEGVVKSPQAQQKYLAIIRDKETEIETMVEQLLAFSKMELDDLPLHSEPLNIRDEISRAVRESGVKNLVVYADELAGESVFADKALLDRIVLNILENSRKYRTGSTAHVDISSRRSVPQKSVRRQRSGTFRCKERRRAHGRLGDGAAGKGRRPCDSA